jgi:hypothetical protein
MEFNTNTLAHLVIGLVLIFKGASWALSGNARINLGAGRRGASPMGVVRVNRTGAVIVGVMTMVGGAIAAFPFFYVTLADHTMSNGQLLLFPVVGVAVVVVGFFLTAMMQSGK